MSKRKRRGKSSAAEEYWFDEEFADLACRFIQELLYLRTGEWAGKRFKLLPWQRKIARDVFGWKRKSDGLRRYREVFIEVGKGNGKTPFAAALALVCLCLDAEAGAEVYTIANDREQATIVFDDAKEMVRQGPLNKRLLRYRNSLVYPHTGSVMKPFSRKTETKHGQRPSTLIFDELHEIKDRNLVEFLTRGTIKRRQPLTVYITTAGVGQESVCWEKHDYAQKVIAWNAGDRDHGIQDDAFYGAIYAADAEDDWTLLETAKKANPSLGVTIQVEAIEREIRKAIDNPAQQNTYRRLHLNQWVGQHERAIDMRLWDKCLEPHAAEELLGRPCFAGLDLSSKLDLTALVLLLPWEDGSYDVVPHFWIPEENMLERVRRDRAPYHLWKEAGLLTATEGNWVDQEAVRVRLNEAAELYRIVQVGYDPWNATKIATELQDQDGIEIVEMRQGYRTLSEPTKALLGLIADGKLRHGGNKMLRWQAEALALKRDSNDNIAPCKKKSTQRIDGVLGMILALGASMAHQEESAPSITALA